MSIFSPFTARPTYYASGTFTPPATPSDMVTVYGSATKIVRLLSLRFGTNTTAAGSQQFFLIKRSAVNTTGTFVPATRIPADSENAAATATIGHYTVNPGGLGAAVGTLATYRRASPVLTPATFAGIVERASIDLLEEFFNNAVLSQSLTLRGTGEGLAVNFNGVALVAGQQHFYSAIWTEDDK